MQVDQETGEILEFRITDQASAEWVLKKMMEARAAMQAIDNTPEVIAAKTIIANAEAIKGDHLRDIQHLEYLYKGQLAEWARQELGESKKRHIKTLYGTVQLKTIPGKWELTVDASDPELVSWIHCTVPEAIKKYVLASKVPDDCKERCEFFEKTEDEERVYIDSKIPE